MLSYRGRKIAPAPFVTVNKSYHVTGDGNKVGVVFDITLAGTMLPWRGSPSGNYTALEDAFWTLSGDPPDETYAGGNEDFNHILRKQEALRWLFSEDGHSLEWQPAGGQPVVKCNPRILDISFPEGTWADRCTYQVTLQADWIYINGVIEKEDSFDSDLIDSGSEEWSFEEVAGQQGSGYRVAHTVTAKGIFGYDETGATYENKEAWEHAKEWVDSRITGNIKAAAISGALGAGTWYGGGYTKNTNMSEDDGVYSISEDFLAMPDTAFTEKSYSFAENTASETIDVSYNGTIYGLASGEHMGGQQAITNAKLKVPSNADAKTDATAALSTFLGSNELSDTPQDKNVGINYKDGQVTFAFRWTAGEDATFSATKEATLNHDADAGTYEISLSYSINGTGDDPATRLANARSAIPTDSEAFDLAEEMIGAQMPAGVTFSDDPSRKTTVFNETQGSVRISYTWKTTDSEYGDYQITVNTQHPSDVTAKIPIPGRSGGPIIQKMNTETPTVVSVTLTKTNNTTKPADGTVIPLMEDAGEVGSTWVLDDDRENWDVIKKVYSRTRIYTEN